MKLESPDYAILTMHYIFACAVLFSFLFFTPEIRGSYLKVIGFIYIVWLPIGLTMYFNDKKWLRERKQEKQSYR